MMNLIKKQIRTEKSMKAGKHGQYVFSVDVRLTKPQIKKLCEEHFGVEIKSVNTHIKRVNRKKFRLKLGDKLLTKRAIITLKKGQRLFETPKPKKAVVENKAENKNQSEENNIIEGKDKAEKENRA